MILLVPCSNTLLRVGGTEAMEIAAEVAASFAGRMLDGLLMPLSRTPAEVALLEEVKNVVEIIHKYKVIWSKRPPSAALRHTNHLYLGFTALSHCLSDKTYVGKATAGCLRKYDTAISLFACHGLKMPSAIEFYAQYALDHDLPQLKSSDMFENDDWEPHRFAHVAQVRCVVATQQCASRHLLCCSGRCVPTGIGSKLHFGASRS